MAVGMTMMSSLSVREEKIADGFKTCLHLFMLREVMDLVLFSGFFSLDFTLKRERFSLGKFRFSTNTLTKPRALFFRIRNGSL